MTESSQTNSTMDQKFTPMILASGPTFQINELFSDELKPNTQEINLERSTQLSSPPHTPNIRKRQTHNSSNEAYLECKKRKEQSVIINEEEISLIMTADEQDEETEDQTRETPNDAEHTRETLNVNPKISDKVVMNSSYFEDFGITKLQKRKGSTAMTAGSSSNINSICQLNKPGTMSHSKNQNENSMIYDIIMKSLNEMNDRLKTIEDKQDKLMGMDKRLQTIEDKQNKIIESVAELQRTKNKNDDCNVYINVSKEPKVSYSNGYRSFTRLSQSNASQSHLNVNHKRKKQATQPKNCLLNKQQMQERSSSQHTDEGEIELVNEVSEVSPGTDDNSLVDNSRVEENENSCQADDSFQDDQDERPSNQIKELVNNATNRVANSSKYEQQSPTKNINEESTLTCSKTITSSRKVWSHPTPMKNYPIESLCDTKSGISKGYTEDEEDEEPTPLFKGPKTKQKYMEMKDITNLVSPDEAILTTLTLRTLFLQSSSPGNFAVQILRRLKPEFQDGNIRHQYSWRGSVQYKKKALSLTLRKFIKKCVVSIYPEKEDPENFQVVITVINEYLRRPEKRLNNKKSKRVNKSSDDQESD